MNKQFTIKGLPNDLLTSEIVNERRLKVSTGANETAFGELNTERLSPITQIKAHNGLLQGVLTVTDDLISGTNSVIDGKFTCETGISADGLASILSLRQLTTRAGQGSIARFPAIFGTGIADNNQAAGLITSSNIFAFSYIGAAFGILIARNGLDEIQELTLTAAAGSESATVTVDDLPYTVPLTGGGITDDAYEIAISLNSQVPNYNFTSNEDTITAQAVLSGPMGGFAYSSDGTSTGGWVQVEAGVDSVTSFVPQSLWNQDTRLEGLVDEVLIPQFNNTYQVQLNGSADFYVEDSASKSLVLVHRESFMNKDAQNNTANSTFRIGWIVRNAGNTSNVTLQGEYAAAFIEGEIYYDALPRSVSNTQAIPAGNSIQTSVLMLRNRLSFSGRINRIESLPIHVHVSTESNKPVFFRVLLNPDFSSPVNFSYADKDASVMEISKDAVVVTGGLEIGSVIAESGSPQTISFNQSVKTTTALYPGSFIAIVATHQSGGAGNSQVSTSFQEDL